MSGRIVHVVVEVEVAQQLTERQAEEAATTFVECAVRAAEKLGASPFVERFEVRR